MTTETTRTIYNPLQRDRVTFLKTAAETSGELMLVEVELAPGGGNPPHYHTSFSERFTPIVGELSVQLGKEQCAPAKAPWSNKVRFTDFTAPRISPSDSMSKFTPRGPGSSNRCESAMGLPPMDRRMPQAYRRDCSHSLYSSN